MKSGCALRMPRARAKIGPAASANAMKERSFFMLRLLSVCGHLSAHVLGNGNRAEAVERNHCHLVARAEFFLAAHRSAHQELDRRAAELRNGELEVQRVAQARRLEEL